MRDACLVPILVLAACGGAHPRPEPSGSDPAALLACWSDALGGRARLAQVRSIEREARTEAEGLAGTLHTWSRADGAWREDAASGPRSNLTVFDGTRGWTRHGLGAPIELAHDELAELTTRGYLESFAPLVAGRMPGRVRAGAGPHTLVVTADHGADVIVVLDPRTCLPQQQAWQIGRERTTAAWSRWTTVDGIRLPGEVQLTTDVGDTERIEYTATRLDVPEDAARFTAPGLDPRARVPHLTEPVTVPAELTQNHVYVQASINGKGPVSLLVDTGANGVMLDRGRARELGLGGEGKIQVRGAGAGSLESQVIGAVTVSFGGVPLTVASTLLSPFTALDRHEGRAMDGILGYEAFGHHVIEFDYAAPAVRLHDAAMFQPPPDAIAVPFYFYDTKPIIDATVELGDGRSLPVHVLVDTGNRGALVLGAAFVAQNHLLDGPGPRLRAPLGFGVGGQTRQALGRVAAIHLGPIVVRDVLTQFSDDRRGAMADDAIQANLGSDLMRQFTVWFDYPRRQMWLRKNAHYGEPFAYDASGLALESADDTYRRTVVTTVLPGSPGDQAGVRPGDELRTIDGEPAARLTLEAIRMRLKATGASIRLELALGDATRAVVLATRRLI